MTIAVDQAIQQQPLSFDEFLAHYGDDNRYELIDGEVFDLEPPGLHEEVAAFIMTKSWRDKSIFIGKHSQISFYHYDFTAQALSKLSRGFDRDIKDVQAMYEQKLFSLEELRDNFEAIAPELIRFPSLNPDVLRSRVENFIECFETNSEEESL